MKVIIIFFLLLSNVLADEITGVPKIIDGDTIHIDGNKIRLEGIDAPEIKQQCKKVSFEILSNIGLIFYKDYSCGIVSKEKLVEKIGRSTIKCISSSKDRYKRYIATCFKNKTNLNQWLVRNGHAIAYRRYSKKYVTDEDFAKDNELGLWKGKFINPEKWRKLN